MEIINEIAREIKGSSNNAVKRTAQIIGLELGTMTGERKVKLDNFKHEVSCLVLHYLTIKEPCMEKTAAGQGNHPHGLSGEHGDPPSGAHTHPDTEGIHVHDLVTPEQLKPLKKGDRVLVALVNGGNDFVIVGRVV